MPRLSGRAAFVKLLTDDGVSHLFGNPGTTELPIMEVLPDHPELQFVLGLLASIIVMAFSRWREFRADAGSARLSGRDKMIAALSRLDADRGANTLPQAIQAFGIAGGGMRKLFSSHPPIAERIAALRNAR